jgi:L-2,4-diaminobutyrate decarboxylase
LLDLISAAEDAQRSAAAPKTSPGPQQWRELVRLDGAVLTPLEIATQLVQAAHREPLPPAALIAPLFADLAIIDLLASWLDPLLRAARTGLGSEVEQALVDWGCRLAEYPAGSGKAFSDRTAANTAALLVAHARWRSNTLTEGKRPVIVMSYDADPSIVRAASAIGVRAEDVLTVPTERSGRVDADAVEWVLSSLESRLDSAVMAIVATAGSESTCAFDDLHRLAYLRDAHRTWLHVDGGYGSTVLFSPTTSGLLHGLERSDSFLFAPTAVTALPFSPVLTVVRDRRWLPAAVGTEPAEDHRHEVPLASQREAFKLWSFLRLFGTAPLAAAVEHSALRAVEFFERLVMFSDFEVLHEPALDVLCFRPRDVADDQVAELQRRLVDGGHTAITIITLFGRRVLRAAMRNPLMAGQDIDALIGALRRARYGGGR